MREAHDHKRVSPEGKAVGQQQARMAESAVARLAAEGEPDERCKTCAFRQGTVPNGCLQTQMDALKAVVEGVPFLCHHGHRAGTPCHGWFAARVAMRRAEQARGKSFEIAACPWEFSPPDEEGQSNGR